MANGLHIPTYATGLQKSIQDQVAKIRPINVSARLDFGNISKFSSPLGKITGQVDDFTKSMAAANARVVAFGGTAAIISSIGIAIRGVVTNTILLEKRLTDLRVVFGANEKDAAKFGKSLFEVARQTGQSFEAVFEAATEFSRQGLGVTETLKRTQDALTITRLTGLSATDAVKGLTAAFESYGEAVGTTSAIVDKFAAVDTRFAVSTADFVQAFQRSASVAKEAGVSFEQLTALVTAAQEKTQRGGANIGNALKSIITVLKTDQSLLDDISKTYNIDVQFDDGSLVDAYTVLEKLGQKLAELPNDVAKANLIKKVAGGRFQANIATAILQDFGQGKEGNAAKALKIQESAAGAAASKTEELNRTLDTIINKTQVSAQQFAGLFGNFALADNAKEIINLLNGGLEKMNSLLDPENTEAMAIAFRAFAKAVGDVATGPGLAFISFIFGKLAIDFTKFGISSAATFLKINQGAKETEVIEKSINSALSTNQDLRNRILSIGNSELSIRKSIVETYAQEANLLTAISLRRMKNRNLINDAPGTTKLTPLGDGSFTIPMGHSYRGPKGRFESPIKPSTFGPSPSLSSFPQISFPGFEGSAAPSFPSPNSYGKKRANPSAIRPDSNLGNFGSKFTPSLPFGQMYSVDQMYAPKEPDDKTSKTANVQDVIAKIFLMQTALSAVNGALSSLSEVTGKTAQAMGTFASTLGVGLFSIKELGKIGGLSSKSFSAIGKALQSMMGGAGGSIGTKVASVGAGFARLLPILGQAYLAFEILSSGLKIFGIDLTKEIGQALGLIKTPAQEAAESLKKFSDSINEQTAQGVFTPMNEVFKRIKGELDRFAAIGKAKTDEERERLQGMTPEQFRIEQSKKDFQEISDSIVNGFSRYNETVTEFFPTMGGGQRITYSKSSERLNDETRAAFGAFITNLLNANFSNSEEIKKGLASSNPTEVAKAKESQARNVKNLLNYGDVNGQDIMSLASQSLSKESFGTFARNFADKSGAFNLKGGVADLSKEKLNLLASGLIDIFKDEDVKKLYKQKKDFYKALRDLLDPTEIDALKLDEEDFTARMKSVGMGENYFQSPELRGRITKNQALLEFQNKLKTENGESITGDQIDYLFSEMKKYSDTSNLIRNTAREGKLSPESTSAFVEFVNNLPKKISDAESKQRTENARRQTEEYQGLLGSARNRINPNFKAERAYSEAFNTYTADERMGFIKNRQNQELSTASDDAVAAAEEFFALLSDNGTISLTNARKASELLFKEFADSVKTSNQAAAALDAWNKVSQENKQIFFEELQASKVASAQLSYRQAKENPYSTRQGIENARIAVNQAEGSGAGSFSQGAKSFVYDLEESQKDFAYNLGKKIPEDFASGMARAFDAMLMETDNLGEALRNIALDFLGTIRQAFLQQAASNIVGSVVSGFASGGYINRGSGTKDDVPALLMKGEYVVNKNSVDKYGKGFFEHLNAGKIQKFATGGIAMPSAGGGGSIVGSSNLLGFATQQYTSGKDDIIAATRAGTSIALEDESRRLSFAALSGQTGSVRTSEIQRAKEQAIDLVMADSEARAAAKKADKEGNKQLLRSLLATAASAGVAYGASSFKTAGATSNYGVGSSVKESDFPAFYGNYNSGGPVLRGSRLRDGVPAMLTGDEYIMNNRAVSKYGKGFMDRVNSQRLNDGTPITNSAPSQVTTTGNTIVNITVNSENSNVTADTASSDGKTDRRKEEELAQKIKQVVLRTITEEKRVSGSLRRA